jgi:hypothetical protein
MVDDRSGSVWSHLDGASISGEHAGQQLRILPLQTTTWGAWLEEHPQSTTVDITGSPFGRVELGASGLGSLFRDTLDVIDTRLGESELVIGVLVNGAAVAFPIDRQPSAAPMQGLAGGVPVVILEDTAGNPALAYHRLLTDGRVLEFERREGAIFDAQTDSRWNSSGLAVAGELAGVQLSFVTSFFTEWYGWAAFHPDTTIYSG